MCIEFILLICLFLCDVNTAKHVFRMFFPLLYELASNVWISLVCCSENNLQYDQARYRKRQEGNCPQTAFLPQQIYFKIIY